MPIRSTSVDTERKGARTSAQRMGGLRGEITVLAEQMGALGSAVSSDAWCGACADGFRGHVAELVHNASSLALGYDDVAIALRGHARAHDALYEDVKDVEERLGQGERDRKRAQAALETADRAVGSARRNVLAAQNQVRSAASDPAGAAQASACSALSGAQAALTAAGRDVTAAEKALATADKAIRAAEDDLDDPEKEHRRIGERCGDEVLDARGQPFHTAAREFVVTSISAMGGTDWTDFLSGVAMMPAVAAGQLVDKTDEIGSTLGALRAARREGSSAERAAARRAHTTALREVRGLRKDVGKLPWQPPRWLRQAGIPLSDVSERLDKTPGVRALPLVSVGLAPVVAGDALAGVKDGRRGLFS